MTYEQVKSLKSEDFTAMCGVRPDTFNQMLEVLRCLRRAAPTHSQPKQKTGRPGKLSLEDQLLMTLEYWSGAGDAPPPESTVPTFI